MNHRFTQLILNYLDYINYGNNRKISFIRKKIFWGGTRIWTKDLSICSRLLYHWAIPPFMKMLPINIHNKESFKDCWACNSSLIYSVNHQSQFSIKDMIFWWLSYKRANKENPCSKFLLINNSREREFRDVN